MTAYGRGMCDSELGRITVDIQSVNRRFLEVNINLPRHFGRFEMDVRKQIAASIGRGSLSVSIGLKSDPNQGVSLIPNIALARGIKGAWEKLAEELWLPAEMPLVLLTQEKDLFLSGEALVDELVYKQALSQAVDMALQALLLMKRSEGKLFFRIFREESKF